MAVNVQPKSKGPWTHRVLVLVFSLLLGVLVYWLLGFIVDDLGSWPGPVYEEVEKRLLDQDLVQQSKELQAQIAEANRSISEQKDRQKVLRDSTDNSERTMNQLLEVQRLSLQKGVALTEADQAALAESKQLFLANQKRYQQINEQIAQLNDRLRELESKHRGIEKQLEEKRQVVNEEYRSLATRHQLILAALKLAVLVPLLAAAVVLLLKKRSSLYAPLFYASGIALLVKVGLVMHEHFPTRYFKYVLILAGLGIVARILVILLRMAAFPKKDWLLKQYRDAYERFLCPICDYPIRRGPLKYTFWSRRSLKKLNLPLQSPPESDEPYSCPVCGTRLFEECPSCHAMRHALLPACAQCGAEKHF